MKYLMFIIIIFSIGITNAAEKNKLERKLAGDVNDPMDDSFCEFKYLQSVSSSEDSSESWSVVADKIVILPASMGGVAVKKVLLFKGDHGRIVYISGYMRRTQPSNKSPEFNVDLRLESTAKESYFEACTSEVISMNLNESKNVSQTRLVYCGLLDRVIMTCTYMSNPNYKK